LRLLEDVSYHIKQDVSGRDPGNRIGRIIEEIRSQVAVASLTRRLS
jgi:hypothetical protein